MPRRLAHLFALLGHLYHVNAFCQSPEWEHLRRVKKPRIKFVRVPGSSNYGAQTLMPR